jgi:8-hydroxy-5-deazaflavin:NADPH oxidoreductase
MKIGIMGAGSIGATLTRRLSEAGHDVKVANSRGPRTIAPELLEFGATPVEASDVTQDVDVLILSTPLNKLPAIAATARDVPPETVVIDTSNYYPVRDNRIESLDEGQVESVWVQETLGRPIVKAWNAITSQSFADKPMPAGAEGRIALPFAADRDEDRAVAAQLIDETGLDPFDAGPIAESWRQQPATPVYCTDLTVAEMPAALAAAQQDRSPRRRDLVSAIVFERTDGFTENMGEGFGDWLVSLNRLVYM